jgi:hypothetical protein
MPAIREFTKKLGPEICRNFEIQWTHGDEDRLEQLQEIMMQEREMAKHGKNEARGTARDGMLHFTIIDREYQATKDNDLDQGIW